MFKVKFYYTVRNCGDGSAAADFHAGKDTAQIACDIEEEGGEPFGDNYPRLSSLTFDAQGRLQNPDATREELLAELDGEDADAQTHVSDKFPSILNRAGMGEYSGCLYYVMQNGGDGSANVGFYADRETAELACRREEKYGAFSDIGPYRLTLSFDADGKLLNPVSDRKELQRQLAEARGEEVEDEAPAAAPPKPVRKPRVPGR